MKNLPIILISVCFLIAAACQHRLPDEISSLYQNLPDKIDFNFQVKPILSDKCFACHGPDHNSLQAGLRLDIRDNAIKKKESGEVPIFPGNSVRSHLVERILSEDPEFVMPPPESHLGLSNEEIAVLIKWIDQGAEYKPHWSFIKLDKSVIPSVENKSWPQNPIDYYTLKKMEEYAFHPSPRAAKDILARRLFFNLTGLPPSLEELDNFAADTSPRAYENLVDQLLASEAYGERMAMEWMDLARYADSDGYLDDKHRDFSPWRDWVIDAFNQNMSYDQFVTWQLAGDLIPETTQKSILATAFNRLHRKNSEAGIVFEEFRTEYVADRTNTLGKAFLGLSVECARCHDHKYDPVSQEDYYRMFAFFNGTNELGTAIYGPDQTPGPSLLLSNQEQREILAYLDNSIKEQEEKLRQVTSGVNQEFEEWSSEKKGIIQTLKENTSKGLVAHYSFDQYESQDQRDTYKVKNEVASQPAVVMEPEIRQGVKGTGVFLNDYTRVNLPKKIGWFERTDPFSISLSIFPDTTYSEAGIFYHCEDLRLGLKGYSLHLDNNQLRFVISHSWPQNAIQVRTREPLQVNDWTHVTITYDGSSQAKGVSIYMNGAPTPLIIDYDGLYKGILYEPDIHTYGFNGFSLGFRDKMKTFKHSGFDELKIYNRQLTALEVLYNYNPPTCAALLDDSDSDDLRLLEFYHQYANPVAAELKQTIHEQRIKLNNEINVIPEIMVMGDLPQPRPTYILSRGVYDAQEKQVDAGAPDAVLAYDETLPANRLGLTKWLFDKENPLTARVLVNRIWQMHFGQGIVKTSDDFGSQGDIPTHPELLDWLAVEFMESGWDIKQLHKTIVMSATFQQSSKTNNQMLAADPDNLLLTRGPSYRLKAEMIRDQALAISGLLVRKLGGPSVYPYQPEGLWDEISNKRWRYPYLQHPGEGLYRRSLYTIWKRTSPPPSMLVFDVPDRSVCKVRRSNTSTPLQALVLLNDPQYLEAARVLAEKIISSLAYSSELQLEKAFRMITGRQADKQEINLLTSFYQEELSRFQANQVDTRDYLSIGYQERDRSLEPIGVAALATVISGIMNTSESYTLR